MKETSCWCVDILQLYPSVEDVRTSLEGYPGEQCFSLYNKQNVFVKYKMCLLFVALRSFGKYILIRGERSSLTDFNAYRLNKQICSYDWINLGDTTQFHCFTLFICGGPCHLSIFKIGLCFPLRTALFNQLWNKKHFWVWIITSLIW